MLSGAGVAATAGAAGAGAGAGAAAGADAGAGVLACWLLSCLLHAARTAMAATINAYFVFNMNPLRCWSVCCYGNG
ncbi:hypothetical protein DF051_38425 [Burkholderia contaminans]|uniref:Uncharacterized protein n=1 Tax=Burkholderia contaminans TaxID=488447 RepID=A0A3N8NV57_9BURK|nr:hypothetical protein DF051_38425 [Burkholderia contaminans]